MRGRRYSLKATPHPLDEKRRKLGLTQYQVNRLIGEPVTAGHLGKMLNGTHEMRSDIESYIESALDKYESEQADKED